jgi:hypothetical protein
MGLFLIRIINVFLQKKKVIQISKVYDNKNLFLIKVVYCYR